MTLGIALRGSDFVVLGADRKQTDFHVSQALTINLVNKIRKVSDQAAYILAGIERGRNVFDIAFDTSKASKLIDAKSGVGDFGISLKENYLRQFGQSAFPNDIPAYTLLITGFDSTNKPRIWLLPSPDFAPAEYPGCCSIGANGQALHFLDKYYDESLSLEQMIFLCYWSIIQTTDDKVGGGTDIVVFQKGQSLRFIEQTELEKLAHRADDLEKLIRSKFQQ